MKVKSLSRYLKATSLFAVLLGVCLTGCAAANVVEYNFNAMLQPVPLTAKWADTNYNIWCGSTVKGDDGKYHLFYSRWPRQLGHQAWASYSEISADMNAPDALLTSNPSVAQRPDGGVLMVYKAVAMKGKPPSGGPVSHLVATAENPIGPFTKHPGEVFGAKGVMFAAEDPFIWRGADRYWAVVKDNDGNFTYRGYSLALWESAGGIDWKLSQHPFVADPGTIRWADGQEEKLTALERPQLVFENGEPVALCCAAANNQSRDGSFNVQIPLKAKP